MSPASASAPAAPDAALDEIEAMLARLAELRDREPSKQRRADFAAAIDRLHALVYRLGEAGPSRAIGLPTPAAKPAAASQGARRLGPAIVISRKPRRR